MSDKKIHFTKMHGAGNDYIYVNTLLYDVNDPNSASVRWSDRHKGIGGDGHHPSDGVHSQDELRRLGI